jgi:glycine/D-amino acid oxidase-like deaminating enzyme
MKSNGFEVDFAVVGAGVAGLWLSAELLHRGSRVLLIDYRLIGQFASSRNQGWLHSGSMYAALNGSTLPGGVARVCLESNSRLKQFCRQYCPDAILKPEGALFLFQDADRADSAASNVEKLGVPTSWVTREKIHGYESRLASSIFSFGFLTETDCAFVPKPILNALVRKNEMHGAIFVGSACPLQELKIEKHSSGWSLWDGAVTVAAANVILCAGAINPLLLKIITGRDPKMRIQRSFIGVFTHRSRAELCGSTRVLLPSCLAPFPVELQSMRGKGT